MVADVNQVVRALRGVRDSGRRRPGGARCAVAGAGVRVAAIVGLQPSDHPEHEATP